MCSRDGMGRGGGEGKTGRVMGGRRHKGGNGCDISIAMFWFKFVKVCVSVDHRSSTQDNRVRPGPVNVDGYIDVTLRGKCTSEKKQNGAAHANQLKSSGLLPDANHATQ